MKLALFVTILFTIAYSDEGFGQKYPKEKELQLQKRELNATNPPNNADGNGNDKAQTTPQVTTTTDKNDANNEQKTPASTNAQTTPQVTTASDKNCANNEQKTPVSTNAQTTPQVTTATDKNGANNEQKAPVSAAADQSKATK